MDATLAQPEKLCINILGDASIGMLGMHIEIAVRNLIGTLAAVFNHGVRAGERAFMPRETEKYKALESGDECSEVARALRARSTRVKDPAVFLRRSKRRRS
jgi:acetolactate synthase I/II/III large subunit